MQGFPAEGSHSLFFLRLLLASFLGFHCQVELTLESQDGVKDSSLSCRGVGSSLICREGKRCLLGSPNSKEDLGGI